MKEIPIQARRLLALLLACLLLAGLCAAAEEADGTFIGFHELPPQALSISKSATRTVQLGLKYQISVPGQAIKRCSSADKAVATVTAAGLVTPLKGGSVKITVTLKGGTKLKLKLKVVDPTLPTGVTIDQGASATLAAGETLRLTATLAPPTARTSIYWASSDEDIATVDDRGLVTALKPGSATLCATTASGLNAYVELTVRQGRPEHYMISHAMGGIDDLNYTNCLEGFLENYEEGHRVFEVDFEYTSDGALVLWHDWDRRFSSKYKKGRVPTRSQFMKSRIYDRYTPLDLEALLKLMAEYPDMRVVTDTKYTKPATVKKQFRAIVSAARSLGVPEVLNRLVVEIYTADMFEAVENVYPFREYMVTLYKYFKKAPTQSQLKTVAKFCHKNGIPTVAMYAKWWKSAYAKILKSYDLEIALYTVNTKREAKDFFEDGVNALFTDFLPPIAG